jgi:hypothetical protein
MSKETCNICVNTFNDDDCVITCLYCSSKTCSQCVKQTFFTSKKDINCVSCKKIYTQNDIVKMFPPSFFKNDLKKIQTNVLLIREKSLLPDSQFIEKSINDELAKITDFISTVNNLLWHLR